MSEATIPLRCIIIDDESNARNTLASFLNEYCKHVEIIAMASNVPEGVLAINKLQPDLVFLDIEMPEYNGFELFNFIQKINFEIIFVTAYSEYAIRAFEVSAIDYLLKPIEIESLQKAVEKVVTKKHHYNIQERLPILKDAINREEIKKIALPMLDGLLFVEVDKIILLEADGSYTSLILSDGSKLYVSKKLKFFEEILQNRNNFFRTHRSFLININFIKKFLKGENNIIMDNDFVVALARERRQEFDALLSSI